ncbi:MAG: tetratricopeptide repeat protein, partial [Chloroflexi bacterium]|nr:tetratricopeptide repeat protein [Chloroflexota bacterium]
MPFIRKANRKLFVGRSNEIATFTTEILRPEEPTFNIISVKGQGGVGKSTLLARFMTEAANPEFRGYCLTAKVDEQQTSPSDIMDILVRQLEKFTQSCTTFTKFKEALAQYRTGLEQLDSEKELPLAIREIESKRFPTFPSLKPPLASSAATSSSKFEETLRGNFLKKQELVTLLLDCPNMANRASRDNLLGGVRKGGLVTNFARNIADNIDVENIVKTLLDYSGALEELLSYIRVKDSGTQAWQALETFQRGLLVDSFPSASPTDWREECYSDLNYGAISFSQSHPLRNSNQQRENLLRRLTQTFVAELNLIVDGKEDQCQQPYRVILLFDTFEQSGVVAAPWLLDYFLPEDIRGNVVLVFAGREALETSIPQEPKRWLPYLQDETTWAFSLDPFSYEETCEFLKERGITDQAHIDNIWKLSTGLPLYLGLLATDAKGEVDPTQSVVDNFLKWIPEEEDEKLKRQLAQEAALLSRPFNREELAAFSYLPEAERDAYFDWLSRLSFVKSNVLDGRYRYHDIARELFSRHLYQSNRELCYKTRHLLAAYYRQKLEKLETEQGKEAIGSNEWLELKLALAQQLFLLPGEVSHLQAIDQIIRAYSKVKKKQEGEIVRVLQEFAEDSIANQANTGVRQLAGQLVTYVEAKSDSEEFTASVNYLFRKIEDNSSASPGLRAEIYRIRGYTYHNVKRYQEALSDFNCAVGLNFGLESAYVGRGITYILLNEYEKAFADLDKAIELDPQYAWAYRKKGETYLLLKEYDKALVDFNKLIELNPQYAWAYGQRGETYRLLKEYDKALTDFGKAIELNPQ